MRGPYDVTFCDDSVERVEADNPEQAKLLAKHKRMQEVDPGGARSRSGQAADVLADKRVKVRRVAEAVALVLLGLGLTAWAWLDPVVAGLVSLVAIGGVLQVRGTAGTAIGGTLAATTAVTGDTFTVPSFPDTKKAWLLQLWADVQVAGTLRVRSPKMHDNVNGIRIDTIISDVNPLLPWGAPQRIYPSDPLTTELAGSTVAGDIEYIVALFYFEELAGQVGRFITPEQLLPRMEYLLTIENTIATGATAAWATAEAINAEIDQFQHNEDYAILGYKVDTECAAIGYTAPDFANVRVGGPGIETEPVLTADWFVRLSKAYGLPLIPIFNAANKASVTVDALQDENGADTTLTTFLARLRKG